MGFVIFINVKAGGGKGLWLKENLNHYKTVILEPLQVEKQIAENVNAGDTVLIAGGDGTVSLVIDGLWCLNLSHEVMLRILPLGTGNDLARSLGVPLSWDITSLPKYFEDTVPEKAQLVPVWRYGRHHFVNYVSFGLDAKILAMVDHWRRRLPQSSYLNKLLYVFAGILCARYRISDSLLLITDKQKLPLQGYRGLILSNIPSYAGGRRVGDRDLSNAELSVTALRSFWDLMRLVLQGSLTHTPILPFTHATSLELQGKPLPVQRDGEVGEFNESAIQLAGRIKIAI